MAVLPQTQCGRCGFAGCRPYARALREGQVASNRCPPGGDYTRLALAHLLGHAALDPDRDRPPEGRLRVTIDPHRCIGCARCLPACPVDAIVGAPGQLHAVIASACTGCGLCLPPCPADCFVLSPAPTASEGPWRERTLTEARAARQRTARKQRRQAAPRGERPALARDRMRREIREAIQRVADKRGWQTAVRPRRISGD